MENRIAIVTPLKDEKSNIELLIRSIQQQNQKIYAWVVVENGSKDGSAEILAKIQNLDNVEHFIVLNYSLPNDKYELGVKYATVVNQGFEYLRNASYFETLDFIGILDADCFPGASYYEKLTDFMTKDKTIGISSGLAYNLNGKYDGKSRDWVRGNCRLWKKACFDEAGYIVGPSADALSVCKAEIKGWRCEPLKELAYNCREVGEKVNYEYYGYSAYFRGITPLFAFLKSLNYLFILKPKNFSGYFKGYFSAFFSKKSRIEDAEIRRYFSNYLAKKMGFQ
ncbi:glycosyltransferase family 2 protein [Leeuwenhoekiella marinoflava]|uniref:Glycosyltransferase involved in cell wall biosynthesis n=2 Tax=Leeuwenhoekiella marinoflava TaxID=988 RepID=A0A4Q0PH60_9FLAO|nr:glycosyltransferase family 2 protein [Leeuwenhoekiella marinoflava]RXG25998.1 glycosyltransferase involved in cell wall biosynthesis [Leeuwenhoekiella marinoflava]SHF75450.1 Glycosyltransferase involved in cell wall bisynthesis [Leeuwenhoekiella marinoflava DSM 3653]